MKIHYKKSLAAGGALGLMAFWASSVPAVAPDELQSQEQRINSSIVQVNNPVRTMARKAAAQDSVTLTVNVTYDNKSETVANALLLPTDIQKLGFIIAGKKNSYAYKVPKGEYEFLLMGAKPSNAGELYYYKGSLQLNNDTTMEINTADVNIETPVKNYLPSGEPVQQDLYITSTKTVAEKGNVHTGSQCILAVEHTRRKQHLAHSVIYLNYQKTKPETATATDTRKKPTLWVNTKDMPLNFFELYKYITPEGIVAMRYDIAASQLGDTIRTDASAWHKTDVKYAEVNAGAPVANFDPEAYNGNGMSVWYDGELVTQAIGLAAADPSDVKTRYWINANKVADEKDYGFGIFPGKALNKSGAMVNGLIPLPLTVGAEGIEYVPVQYVFSGLKIWAGSDGDRYYINKAFNPRYAADASTVWGEGFPYTGFYSRNLNNVVSAPTIELGIKGINGEQRSVDMGLSALTAEILKEGVWTNILTDIPDNINKLGSALNTAKYLGPVAVAVTDTNYNIAGVKGISVSRLEFDTQKMTDQQTGLILPVVNMVNFRNKDGKIATSVEQLGDASVEVYAADMKFNMVSMMGFKTSSVSEVKARIKANESDKWTEVPMTANPEYDNPLFWGNHYSGSMKSLLPGFKAGAYDLELTVSDALGGKYILTASPAFYVEKDDTGVGLEEIVGTASGNLLVADGSISWPGHEDALIEVYDAAGVRILSGFGSVSIDSVAKGLFIIQARDGDQTLCAKVIL